MRKTVVDLTPLISGTCDTGFRVTEKLRSWQQKPVANVHWDRVYAISQFILPTRRPPLLVLLDRALGPRTFIDPSIWLQRIRLFTALFANLFRRNLLLQAAFGCKQSVYYTSKRHFYQTAQILTITLVNPIFNVTKCSLLICEEAVIAMFRFLSQLIFYPPDFGSNSDFGIFIRISLFVTVYYNFIRYRCQFFFRAEPKFTISAHVRHCKIARGLCSASVMFLVNTFPDNWLL